MSVGVMEDYKLRDLRASHTLLQDDFTGPSSRTIKTFELLFFSGQKRQKKRAIGLLSAWTKEVNLALALWEYRNARLILMARPGTT
jgi:hypothetical protein